MKYYVNKERYIKEGRGVGTFSNYKPWLDIRSFPSRGRVTRVKGTKTNRMHTFFSDLELKYFYILEWLDDVIDIREQFPLIDVNKTFEIANKKNIKHPINTVDKTLNVFTTDFMITKKIGSSEILVARTIKYCDDLDKKRTIELFEIEKEYWKSKGVDWAIVTDKNIPNNLVENIKWIHKFSNLNSFKENSQLSDEKINSILASINEELYSNKNQNGKLDNLLISIDDKYSIERGISLNLFKYGIFNKIINVDMNKELKLNPYVKDILVR